MGLVDGVGRWAHVADPSVRHTDRPALFLDRDGVLVRDTSFLRTAEEVVLLAGAATTVAAFNRAGIPVIVVTNQSGIARGLLSWRDFELVEAEVARRLWSEAGARIDAVFACGYHEAGSGGLCVGGDAWRKPNPGMLHAAADALGVRLDASWIVGDRARDLAAGRAAGLAGGVHVGSGPAELRERSLAQGLAMDDFQVWPVADLRGAISLSEAMSSAA